MIYSGKNITFSNNNLIKTPIDYLYNAIKNPKPEIIAQIRQLRVIRDLDSKKYSLLKRQLPYFVCGNFSPPYRRTENFAFIEYFVVDIDHLSGKEIDINELAEKLTKDSRILLLFKSPGEDGLKLMFKLSEKCYDTGIFSCFYKIFATKFAQEYNLEQVVDIRTSDATRACFVSYDPNIYYNKNAEPINLTNWVNLESPSEIFSNVKEAENSLVLCNNTPTIIDTTPDEQAITKIKEILNLNRKSVKPQREVIESERLNEIIDDLKKYIESTGVTITDIISINYGKKIKMKLGTRNSEINVFYGRHGFSVVESPKHGTSYELNQMLAELIQGYVDGLI
jgi:VirE N-terminal domain.